MTANPTTTPAHLRMRGYATALMTAGAVLGGTALAAPAQAAAPSLGQRALAVAESKHGDSYRYGAAGPNHFDCSGLTYYSFRKVGKHLPRTAQAQYNSVRHISKSSLRVGDLVFFHSGSYVYHVGIYAGHGRIWHSPEPGSYVKLEKIWTKSVWYGRA